MSLSPSCGMFTSGCGVVVEKDLCVCVYVLVPDPLRPLSSFFFKTKTEDVFLKVWAIDMEPWRAYLYPVNLVWKVTRLHSGVTLTLFKLLLEAILESRIV